MSNKTIYDRLVTAGMTPESAAGLMGNMNAESAMRANNAQDGMTSMSDADYTAAVDNGSYTNFVRDAVGYGLCQWTYWTRKQALLNYAKQRGVSVGDESMQVDFCIHELKTSYSSLWAWLCSNKDVYSAADRICREYERPAVNNVKVRADAASTFFKQFGGVAPSASESVEVESVTKLSKEQVSIIQGALVAVGYDIGKTGQCKNGVDGLAGEKTKAAIQRLIKEL